MRKLVFIGLCFFVLALSATYGHAARKGLQATPAEEMPTAGQNPEVAQIKDLLKTGVDL